MSDSGPDSEIEVLLESVPSYGARVGASDSIQSPDIDSSIKKKDQNLKCGCLCLHKLKCPVLPAIFLLALILIPAELVIHSLLIAYPLQTCNDTINVANELLQPENTNDLQAVRPLEDERDRVTRIIRVITNTLRIFEYLYLAYGFHSFYSKRYIWEKQLNSISLSFFPCKIPKTIKKCKHCFNQCLLPLLIILLICGFGLVAPSLGITTALSFKSCKKNGPVAIYTAVAHDAVNVFAFCLTVSVRIVLVYFTAICAAIWSANYKEPDESSDSEEPLIPQTPEELGICTTGTAHKNAWKTASEKYYNNIMDYNARTKVVKPIYKIFRSWFVIQWVIFLIYIVSDSANVFRTLQSKTAHASHIRIFYIVSFTSYESLVLILSYACALKMNSAMEKYLCKRKKLQMSSKKNCSDCEKIANQKIASCSKCKELDPCDECKRLQKTCANCQYVYVYSTKLLNIEKNPDSEFKPRIPLIGIDISIATPGFITGVIVALSGVVLGLVTLP